MYMKPHSSCKTNLEACKRRVHKWCGFLVEGLHKTPNRQLAELFTALCYLLGTYRTHFNHVSRAHLHASTPATSRWHTKHQRAPSDSGLWQADNAVSLSFRHQLARRFMRFWARWARFVSAWFGNTWATRRSRAYGARLLARRIFTRQDLSAGTERFFFVF